MPNGDMGLGDSSHSVSVLTPDDAAGCTCTISCARVGVSSAGGVRTGSPVDRHASWLVASTSCVGSSDEFEGPSDTSLNAVVIPRDKRGCVGSCRSSAHSGVVASTSTGISSSQRVHSSTPAFSCANRNSWSVLLAYHSMSLYVSACSSPRSSCRLRWRRWQHRRHGSRAYESVMIAAPKA